MARLGPLAGKDVDAFFNALRPRIIGLVAGTPGQPGPAGPKGVVWRGPWAADTDYNEGDIVTSATVPGTSPLTFFCIEDNTSLAGSPPTVGGDTNWHEINAGYLFTDGSRPYVLAPGHTPTEGTLHWDTSTGIDRLVMDVAGAAGLVQTPVGGVYVRVLNSSGVAIGAGKGVSISGATGNTLTVQPGSSALMVNDSVVLGVSLQSIADAAEGWVCCHGYAGALDMSGFAAGDQLYLGAADGDLTTTIPHQGCAQRIRMGVVINAANPGTLWVQPDHRPDLDEGSNVSIGDYDVPKSIYDVPMWLPDPTAEWCDAWRDTPVNRLPLRTEVVDYTIAVKDAVIMVDDSMGDVTIQLPNAATSVFQGVAYTIKKITGEPNVVIILPNGTDTIDGEASLTLVANGESVTLQSDGGAEVWRVV